MIIGDVVFFCSADEELSAEAIEYYLSCNQDLTPLQQPADITFYCIRSADYNMVAQ